MIFASSERREAEEGAQLLPDSVEKQADEELNRHGSHIVDPTLTADAPSLATLAPQPHARLTRSCLALLKRLAFAALPSFVQSRLKSERGEPEKIHPTAYLDGVRGVAAFFVFMGHWSYTAFDILSGYASRPHPNEHRNFLKLPFIRLFYSGSSAVAVFFVISGYALSAKPVRQARAGQLDGLCTTVASATFRRGFRLFLPCAISTFIIVILIWLGLYDYTRAVATSDVLMPNFHEYHKDYKGSLYLQIRDWRFSTGRFIWVWNFMAIYGGSTDYDLHLWTIPVEYRCSMLMFLTQIGLSRMKPLARMGLLVLLCWFALTWGRWDMILFWNGMILAEWDLIKLEKAKAAPKLPADAPPPKRDLKWWLWYGGFGFNFVFALYLLSYPEHAANTTPGFIWLERHIPRSMDQKYRFWPMVGAIQLMWSITNVKALTDLFVGPLIQYLGKVSYALYLMHGPVIHTWGYGSLPFFWGITGRATPAAIGWGYFFATLWLIPATFWAADLFWRAVDIPVVKFARWVESLCVVTS